MNNWGWTAFRLGWDLKKQLMLTFSPWTREIFVLFYAWTPPNPLQLRWVIHGSPHHHLRLLGLFTLLLVLKVAAQADRTAFHPQKRLPTGFHCQCPQNSDKWGSLDLWFLSGQISPRKKPARSVFVTWKGKSKARVELFGCFSLYFNTCSR